MEALVQQIIENSKQLKQVASPRVKFFRAFDEALHAAAAGGTPVGFLERIAMLEQYGCAAGIPAHELTSRKNTLLWVLAQAT